jgi:Flp pilus assembly protein TadD
MMANPMSFGTALTAVGLVGMLAGCATSANQSATRASIFGDKVDSSNIGLATRAAAALEKGDSATAISLAERAVANTANDAGFRALLGNAYFAAGRFASAEAAYRDSLTLLPTQSQVALKLVLVTIAQGKAAEATGLLEQVRSMLDPADYGLAMALAGDANGAIAVLDASARQVGADSRVRQNLALAHALAGDWQMAREVASQDVAADQLDARIQQWMTFAKPVRASDQVASMVGVTPALTDPGQPVRLALNAQKDGPRYAEAGAVPVADNLSPAAPAAIALADVVQPAPVVEAAFEAARTMEVAAADPLPAEPAPVAVLVPAPAPVVMAAAMPAYVPAVENVALEPVAAELDTSEPKVVEPARLVRPAAAKPRFRRPAIALGPVANGRSVVQLGAFSSRDNVASAWDRYTAKYPSLRGRAPVTARHEANGVVVYRLSVSGFDSSRDAQGFCASLKRTGGNCFVRTSAGDRRVELASRS